jgi:hypothetical protein
MGDPKGGIPAEGELQTRFEQMLINHAGLGKDYGDFPLNLTTLSCGVLLAEREREVQSGARRASDRYTVDSLPSALRDIGVPSDGAVKQAVQDMVRKGYLNIGPEDRLVVQERLTALIQDLDGTFPQMQGLQLVAYLVQTIEEVLSGRKDYHFAVEQFDQTLHLHRRAEGSGKKTEPPQSGPSLRQKKPSAKSLKSALSRRLRTRQTSRKQGPGEPVVVSAAGKAAPLEVKKVCLPKRDDETAGDPSPGPESENVPQREERSPGRGDAGLPSEPDAGTESNADGPVEVMAEETWARPDEKAALEEDDVLTDVEPDPPHASGDNGDGDEISEDRSKREAPVSEATEPDSAWDPGEDDRVETDSPAAEPENEPPPDEIVNERIEAFYQTLAMTCPVCQSGQISEQHTEKGKTFFTCSNPDCVFVSWGKPYTMPCPWCKNPFLVEATGKDETSILRCPRATCRYEQGMSDPIGTGQTTGDGSVATSKKPVRKARRLVRRRVVRKKR